MKKLLSVVMMAMFLVSVTGVAFADEKGDHGQMKSEKKAEKKEKKK